MIKYKERNELRDIVINSFSKEVEIYSVFFFGKEVDNKADEYSDIDMIVCSNDLKKTQLKYLQIFNSISPIIGSNLLNNMENDIAQMIMLKDFSPYQKIDFSITDNINTKIKAGFGPFISVYEEKKPLKKVNSKLRIINESSVKNQFDDFLFSVPRFTKCLFRKNYDMYRRWKGISDIVMVLLYEKHFGWEERTLKKKILAKEISELYKKLSVKENERLNRIFPLNGNLDISKSYKACFNLLSELCINKADYFSVDIDKGFVKYIERFLNSEIERYTCS